ncbi:MAG TPA: glycosyltransferase family 39 protein [Candidatus Binataceae bacterium]|nr:glycosyltransferase family 39 protein [Candidatus Binataceae bacterium]
MTAPPTTGTTAIPHRLQIPAIFSLLLVILMITLHQLGSGPCEVAVANPVVRFMRSGFCGADVCGTNEAIEGVFVQDMVERGQVLFPTGQGGTPMYKPPLFHWTALAIDRLFGIHRVTAFNLRLPSVLYALATAILVMAFAMGRFGAGAGLLAGLVLAGSYQFIEIARMGRVDMVLTCCEALALLSFLWWMPARGRPPARGAWPLRYLFAAALGAAVLAKGPVGMLLPGLAIAIFMVSERRFGELWSWFIPGPAVLAIAIGASWYLACFFAGRYSFLNRQLSSENFGRFIGTLGAMPPWYYLKPLLLNSGPLSLIAPFAMFFALRVRQPATDVAAEPAALEAAARRRDALRLLAIFWIVTVVFFSLAAYKRRSYLLPLWPASAVMIAWWFESLGERFAGRFARAALAIACASMVIFNFLYIPWHEQRECAGQSYRAAATMIDRTVGPREPLYAYGFRADLAPLVFYLDRYVTPIHGRLGDAPPGYVLVPGQVWAMVRDRAPGLAPVLIAPHGRFGLVLLSHGRFYARNDSPASLHRTMHALLLHRIAALGSSPLHDFDAALCSPRSARCRRMSYPPFFRFAGFLP